VESGTNFGTKFEKTVARGKQLVESSCGEAKRRIRELRARRRADPDALADFANLLDRQAARRYGGLSDRGCLSA
jgi:hypothetical protein